MLKINTFLAVSYLERICASSSRGFMKFADYLRPVKMR
jgi:hypothetical protein